LYQASRVKKYYIKRREKVRIDFKNENKKKERRNDLLTSLLHFQDEFEFKRPSQAFQVFPKRKIQRKRKGKLRLV
jgi:hypothetical protein